MFGEWRLSNFNRGSGSWIELKNCFFQPEKDCKTMQKYGKKGGVL